MGHPVPDVEPTDWGDTCDLCVPELWADGETPAHVKVLLFEIEPCPIQGTAPCGEYELTQTDPCIWRYEDDDWVMLWGKINYGTLWALRVLCKHCVDGHLADCFIGNGDDCQRTYDNAILLEHCPDEFVGAHGGSAVVFWHGL